MMLLTSMTVYRCVIVVASRWTAVPRRRLRYALAACTASWVVSLAASLSDVIASQVQEVENGTRIFTCEVLPGTTDEEVGYSNVEQKRNVRSLFTAPSRDLCLSVQ